MTYQLPESLAELRAKLISLGLDVTAFKTERHAAFMIQQLFGTRFKFPAKGASCFPLLQRLQASVDQLPLELGQVRDNKPPSMHAKRRSIHANPSMDGLVIFCDGACEPNPGLGGWGFVVYRDGVEIYTEHGGDPVATNNIMEMTGALMALRWFADRAVVEPVRILCDSQYVVKGCNHWRHGWKAKEWKRGQKPLANSYLWRELDEALILVPITLEWVKGHSGTLGNERADELAEMGRQSVINPESIGPRLIEKQLQYVI